MFKRKPLVMAITMAMMASATTTTLASGFMTVPKSVHQNAQNTQPTQKPDRERVIEQSRSHVATIEQSRSPVAARSASVTHRGAPFANQPIIIGSGTNVTLREALLKVVPTRWNVFDGTGHVDMDARVDWVGGSGWASVLGMIASSANIHAIIDWNAREIVLLRAPAQRAATQPPVTRASTSSSAHSSSRPTAHPTPLPSPQPSTQPAVAVSGCDINHGVIDTWAINAGDTLSDVFRRWSEQSGKRFIVEMGVQNHEISEAITIRGTLVFAMKQLIDAANVSMNDHIVFDGCGDRVEVRMGR